MRDDQTKRVGRSLVPALRALVGHDHVLVDDDARVGYERDWTGRFVGRCHAVVRPGSTDEVAEVLRWCNDAAVAVVTQAGNTGLVGGGVPRPGGPGSATTVVLSTRRLDHVGPVDPAALQVELGAGVTVERWQRAARSAGFDAPIDFAARSAATVGGAIATDAGGSRVVRFGTMRRQVVGIEAVLADGSVVGSTSPLPKETVGLHWPSVLTGSEGILGVITRARVRVVPRFDHVATALVSLRSIDDAIALLGAARRRLGTLDAIEFLEPEAMRLVAEHFGASPPVDLERSAAIVLVECADRTDPSAALTALLADVDGVVSTAIATDAVRRDGLMRWRDRLTEAINLAAGAPPLKLDVAVPLDAFATTLECAHAAALADGARLIAFGHLAEGNLHLNVLGASDTEQLSDAVLTFVAAHGGTISAEHGIGVAKARWLHLVRSVPDLAAQRRLKAALDPNAILNPGVLDPWTRGAREATQVPTSVRTQVP